MGQWQTLLEKDFASEQDARHALAEMCGLGRAAVLAGRTIGTGGSVLDKVLPPPEPWPEPWPEP